MTQFRIIRYDPRFREPMAALHAETFGLDAAEALAYLEWKYEQNPYMQDPLLFLALDAKGTVVGMRGFYGTRWETPGGPICVPCGDDFAILSSERDSGLATALMHTALAELGQLGFDYVMNSSGGTVTVLQQLAMGWKSLGAMEPVQRLTATARLARAYANRIDRLPALRRFAGSMHADASSCFTRLHRSAIRAESRGTGVAVDTVPRTTAMAELAARCRDPAKVRHVRDASYFDWRFRNPTRDYRFVYLERDGALCSYLIVAAYRRFAYRGLRCSIVDLEGVTGRDRADLFSTLMTWGKFDAIGAWSAAFSLDGRQSLTDAGFVPSELEARARGLPCALLKQLATDRTPQANLLLPDLWDVRMIDSMHG